MKGLLHRTCFKPLTHYMHACIHTRTHAHPYEHTHAHVCAHTHTHPHIHTYIRVYIHTYNTYMHTYNTYIQYIHTYNTYIQYIQYIHTYIHTIHTCIHTIHTYNTYIHTYNTYIQYIQYIHTYNTYIHTWQTEPTEQTEATDLVVGCRLRVHVDGGQVVGLAAADRVDSDTVDVEDLLSGTVLHGRQGAGVARPGTRVSRLRGQHRHLRLAPCRRNTTRKHVPQVFPPTCRATQTTRSKQCVGAYQADSGGGLS